MSSRRSRLSTISIGPYAKRLSILLKMTSPAAKSGSNIRSSGTNWPKLISFWLPTNPALGSSVWLTMTCIIPRAAPNCSVIRSLRNECLVSTVILPTKPIHLPIPDSTDFIWSWRNWYRPFSFALRQEIPSSILILFELFMIILTSSRPV